MGFENFKKMFGITAAISTGIAANADDNNKKADAIFANPDAKKIEISVDSPKDSTKNTGEEDPINTLKPGEKFRQVPVNMELGGIKAEGMILIPMPGDTTKNYYLIKFSGEGENLIGKILAALKALNLKPGSGELLKYINDEAFRKAGKSVMAIDKIYTEAENLGQNQFVLVNENRTVMILNALKNIQTTEIRSMTQYGTTIDYAIFVTGEKNKSSSPNNGDYVSTNK